MVAQSSEAARHTIPADLAGRVAIVTGGSSGIGEATVRALARAKAKIALTTHHKRDDAEELLREVRRLGGEAIVRRVDVGKEDQVEALFEACEESLGLPTLLVNSAGINAASIPVAEMTLERWQSVIETNLTGAFLTCRALARRLRGRSWPGRIVNISSIHEDIIVPGGADYDASKGGLRQLTRTLAAELAPARINVNSVAPGMILTPMNQEAMDDPEKLREATRNIPWGRAGTAEEVAALIVLLLSDVMDYLTGETIVIDGGLSLNIGQGA